MDQFVFVFVFVLSLFLMKRYIARRTHMKRCVKILLQILKTTDWSTLCQDTTKHRLLR